MGGKLGWGSLEAEIGGSNRMIDWMKRRKTHEHVVVVIEVVDGGEGFTGGFCGREVRFCVRGCDYGQGAAEGGFDFGVEMVAVCTFSCWVSLLVWGIDVMGDVRVVVGQAD